MIKYIQTFFLLNKLMDKKRITIIIKVIISENKIESIHLKNKIINLKYHLYSVQLVPMK